MKNYRLFLWIFGRNLEIIIRRHLSALFAVVLAVWTLILEGPKLAHWPPTIELPVALLALGTVLAAAWELKGNKLELSHEQARFLVAMRSLFSELGKFCYGKDREPDLTKRLDQFVDSFLNITSYSLLGKERVESVLAMKLPGSNEFSVLRTSSRAEGLKELTIPIERGSNRNSIANIYVPNWKWKGGLVLGSYSEATQVTPIKLTPISGLEKFRTILLLPIDIYQERNRKRLYGRLIYLTETTGHFLPEEIFMAGCYANILSQVFAMAELEVTNVNHKNIQGVNGNNDEINAGRPNKSLHRKSQLRVSHLAWLFLGYVVFARRR
jgi:hypothetical protein